MFDIQAFDMIDLRFHTGLWKGPEKPYSSDQHMCIPRVSLSEKRISRDHS